MPDPEALLAVIIESDDLVSSGYCAYGGGLAERSSCCCCSSVLGDRNRAECDWSCACCSRYCFIFLNAELPFVFEDWGCSLLCDCMMWYLMFRVGIE